LKCDPTSAGRAIFSPGVELRCTQAGNASTVRVKQVRAHKDRLLIALEGVDDPNAAAGYVGALLQAPRDWIALEAGEYLDADLVGCRVHGADGTDYGSVQAVEHYPASDMLVVGDTLVPMVAAFVTEIDIGQRRIVIDPPAGLFD
jgi:16S rRNA processing protein RimM